MHKNIHALSGTGTHDPSVWAGEESSCFRPHGHRDRLPSGLLTKILCTFLIFPVLLEYKYEMNKGP
jgi:hypothetical protein